MYSKTLLFLSVTSIATAQMTWTGEVAPGDVRTFRGEAQDVHAQILAANPDFEFAWAKSTTADGLEKRAFKNGNCGVFASASSSDAESNADLVAARAGTCNVSAGPSKCIRVACKNTSGIYLCNDNTNDISPPCQVVAQYAAYLDYYCVPDGQPKTQPVAGQIFDDGNWNVVVGYANCNDSPSTSPNDYTPPGPNGQSGECTGCVMPNIPS